jgi:hypothetical protein
VAADGAHERTLLALGTQRSVDGPQAAFGRRRRAGAHRRGRESRADAQRRVLVDPVGGLGDEDDVDVADVVELAATGLAHADDGEAAGLVAFAVLLASDRQGRLQGRLGQLREGLSDGGHLRQRVRGGHVERRDTQQPASVGDAQRVERSHVAAVLGDGPDELVAHLLARAAFGVRGVEPVLGVADQLVDEGRRRAEDPHDAVPADALRGELTGEGGDPPLGWVIQLRKGLRNPHEPEQSLVGVGCVADDGDEVVQVAVGDGCAQRQQRRVREERRGPVRVGEAEPGEGSLGGAGAR